MNASSATVPNTTSGCHGDSARTAHENATSTIANTIIATMPATIAGPQAMLLSLGSTSVAIAVPLNVMEMNGCADAYRIPESLHRAEPHASHDIREQMPNLDARCVNDVGAKPTGRRASAASAGRRHAERRDGGVRESERRCEPRRERQ